MLSIASVNRGFESEPNAAMPDDHAQGPDNPEPLSQPSEADSSTLESLPDELLIKIFDKLGQEERRRGWTTKSAVSSGYHAICLVSKRIDIIARPYLFKTIALSDFRSLVRLCRTIFADEHLGHAISEIKLEVDFHRMTKRGPHGLTSDEEAEVREDCYQIMGGCGSETSLGDEQDCDLIGKLCYELLARAINLCSLTMAIKRRWSFHRGHQERYGVYSAFFDLVRGTAGSAADGAATVFLPLLEDLTLKGCRGDFCCELFGHFLSLPRLKGIRSVRDDGHWRQLAHSDGNGFVGGTITRPVAGRNIVRLHLFNNYARQDHLEDIVQSFPCLQALSVYTRAFTGERPGCYIPVPGSTGLSIALNKLTDLRRLKFDFYPDIAFSADPYDHVTPSLGPGKVLDLAQLPFLHHISVPVFMFAREGTTAVPRAVLPQALKSLALLAHHECTHPDGQTCWDSMPAVLGFLELLGRDLSNFGQLKTVTYCFRGNSCANPMRVASTESRDVQPRSETPEDLLIDLHINSPEDSPEDSTCTRVQGIHASFAEQNVEFCVQEKNGELERRKVDFREWK